jgi:hypothetical protein
MSEEDVRWLNRITHGIDSRAVDAYVAVGRKRYLEMQLSRNADDAPQPFSPPWRRMPHKDSVKTYDKFGRVLRIETTTNVI